MKIERKYSRNRRSNRRSNRRYAVNASTIRRKQPIKASTGGGYTEDFGEICSTAYERHEVIKLLQAWENWGLPDDFDDYEIRVGCNYNSEYVFLTNENGDVCLSGDDGRLYSWYITPYAGYEGFAEDLVEQYIDDEGGWVSEDIKYLKDICKTNNIDFPEIESD